MAIRADVCFDRVRRAAGGDLTDEQIEAVFEEVNDINQRLNRTGLTTNKSAKLKDLTAEEAEAARIQAAIERRNKALTIQARTAVETHTSQLIDQGLTPRNAFLAVMEGTQQGVQGGRASVGTRQLAYQANFMGRVITDLEQRPHLVKLVHQKDFDNDVMREMTKPGDTTNDDAKFVANIYARHLESIRQELNGLGASVGKLDGYAGPQTHDYLQLLQRGEDDWIDFILPRLDLDRTFPDAVDEAEVRTILKDVFLTLTTGVQKETSSNFSPSTRVNPASLAKRLGRSRVLHFRDADAAIDYRDNFGHGTTTAGVINHIRQVSQTMAAMEVFGPNVDFEVDFHVKRLQQEVRESGTLSSTEKEKQISALGLDSSAINGAKDIMLGYANRPENLRNATIGGTIRSIINMARLGGSTVVSIPTDTATAGMAGNFRTGNFSGSMVNHVFELMRGRRDQGMIAARMGEGFDGIVGSLVTNANILDNIPGRLSRLQQQFFKWNGLQPWTDTSRAAAARMVAWELGERSGQVWNDLEPQFRHVLGLHNITDRDWQVLSKIDVVSENGKKYLTPDTVQTLSDDDLRPIVAGRLARSKPENHAAIFRDARRKLELKMNGYVSDEVRYGIIESDPQSRRLSGQSTRPGSGIGEAIRFVMQFKSFLAAYTTRILGRGAFGAEGSTRGQRFLNSTPHLGKSIVAATVAGYLALVMRDTSKGYWPPRSLDDPKVWLASLAQSGAMGIYSDFLFGEVNRFGNGPLSTLAGPSAQTGTELIQAYQLGIAGEFGQAGSRLFNTGLSNVPFVNMFYVRPVLDYLVLDAIKETMSPGYLRRRQTRRRQEYNQERVF